MSPSVNDPIRPTAWPGLVDVTLASGLRVLLLPGHTAPVVSTSLGFRVGSRWEPAGLTGVSHFLEHMMFKGTRRHGKGEIDRLTQGYGGGNNAYTWLEDTVYDFSLPLDRWREALALEADRMRGLRLDPTEFASEKAVVLEEALGAKDLPGEELFNELRRTAYPEHGAGRPVLGLPEDLRAMTPAGMRGWYDRFYHPRNAVLAVVGRFEPQEVLGEIQRLFDGLSPGPPPPDRPGPPEYRGGGRIIRHRRPAEAPIVQLGYPICGALDADWPGVEVLRCLLTEGWSGRLIRRLIRDDELAAEVAGTTIESQDPDLFMLELQLRPGIDPERALAAMDDELARLQQDGPADWELDKARRVIELWLRLDHQRAEAKSHALVEAALLGRLDWSQRLLERARRVTAGEIRDLAARYLDPARRVMGILEPGNGEAADGAAQEAAAELASVPPDRIELPTEPVPSRTPSQMEPLPPVQYRPLVPERITLSGGLRCTLLPLPGARSISIRARLEAGADGDPAGAGGLAMLTAACLRRGTDRWSDTELSRLVERRGIRLAAGADRYEASVVLDLLPEDLETGLDVLEELLIRPTFPERELTRQRDLALASIQAAEDDPYSAGSWRFQRLAYQGDPRGRPPQGTVESLEGLDLELPRRLHQARYRPGRTRLHLAGDLPVGLPELLAERLAGWEPSSEEADQLPPPPAKLECPWVIRHPLERDQVHLFLGHRGIPRADPGWPAALVLNQILGSSAGLADRLNHRLRDTDGLAYTVYAAFGGGRGPIPGTFTAYIGTSPENTERSLAGIREEIQRIRTEPASPEELIRARNGIIGATLFGFETVEDMASYLNSVDWMQQGDDLRQLVADRLAAVTAEDVLQAARRWLRPEDLRLLAAGAVDEGALTRAGF